MARHRSSQNESKELPELTGRRARRKNALATINPRLAKEWHLTKNDGLTPHDVAAGSNKKISWICKKDHVWQATVNSRNSGTGCPYCANRKACKDNCLATQNPELAKEWHPKKNKKLTSADVVPGSNKTAWWKCQYGHEWQASVNTRNRGHGCPVCAGSIPSKSNNLQTVYPNLAKEWHPNKNAPLKPSQVAPSAAKKVWWKCNYGHAWQATINSRAGGRGCPFCHAQSSIPEIRAYSELKFLFKGTIHRKKIDGIEIDIFIPSLKIGIEVDGWYWHKNKLKMDKQKNELLETKGIALIRFRENKLKKISELDIKYKKGIEVQDIKKLLGSIQRLAPMDDDLPANISGYLKTNKLENEKLFYKLLSTLPGPLPGRSLAENNPELKEEWHYKKNRSLKPENISARSGKKVWWRCKKKHEWQAAVSWRTDGSKCPYCASRKAGKDNNLAVVNTELASEWHPVKNGARKPKQFLPNSGVKVWWQCTKNHQWQATIQSRNNGCGCPFCSGRFASKENSLKAINPKLAKEWNHAKNGKLKPEKFGPNSNKKIWWKCGRGHEWQSTIINRNSGNRCPYCSGKLATPDRNFVKANPKLREEWHPTKNGNLKPENFTPHSNKKAWWVTEKVTNGALLLQAELAGLDVLFAPVERSVKKIVCARSAPISQQNGILLKMEN